MPEKKRLSQRTAIYQSRTPSQYPHSPEKAATTRQDGSPFLQCTFESFHQMTADIREEALLVRTHRAGLQKDDAFQNLASQTVTPAVQDQSGNDLAASNRNNGDAWYQSSAGLSSRLTPQHL